MANWTTERQPFGPNHAPVLSGWAADGSGAIPIAVDSVTGRVLVSGLGQGLIPESFDHIDISNYTTGGSPQHVVYKLGGALGTTVATLDITYDTNDNPLTVTRT